MDRLDFLLTDDFEDKIENGDFAVGIADNDNVKLLIDYVKGHLRQYVTVGIDYITAQNGVLSDVEMQRIKDELLKDGYIASLIRYDATKDKYDIKYN